MSTEKPIVKLNLVGLDGNAFALLGAFDKAAKKAGWSKQQINEVMSEARSGDYNHLLRTLMANIEDEEEEDEDNYDEDAYDADE